MRRWRPVPIAMALALMSFGALSAATPAPDAAQKIDSNAKAEAAPKINAAPDPRPTDPMLAEVRRAMNAGDFERAALLLKPMVEAQPANIGLANDYAYALARTQRDDEARKVLEHALGNNDQSAEAFANLREILSKQAAAAYSKALGRKAPNTPLALRRTGEGPPKPPPPETLAGAGTSAVEAGLVPAVTLAEGAAPGASRDRLALAMNAVDDKLSEEVSNATRGWAQAWSAKDFDAYTGFYSSSFEPQSHSSIEEWRESRRPRILKAEKIMVQVSDFKVRPLSDKEVEVRFRQRYESGALKVNSLKTIVWVQEDSGWKIRKEEGR